MVSENSKPKRLLGFEVSYIPLTVCAILTVGVIYLVYLQTQTILKERLKERLEAIAATAAIQFDANEIEKIQELEKADPELALKSSELARTVDRMKKIRDSNKNLQYIYIWSKTDDPNTFAFTADAEMIDPIDLDGNGVIEDIEIPPAPGEPYDVTGIELLDVAFERPVAQNEFIIDQWGTFLSGFAPIKKDSGETVAIIGFDVEVGDYHKLIRATLIPFVVLAGLLLLILTIQTVTLIRIWRNRVEIVKELDRQKDELLSIVSHQLATPVSSMKWYMEMLLDGDLGKLTKEQMKHIETVQGITANLTDLVSMILDVSRIQLGRMQVDRAPLDLGKFFTEILQVIEPKAKERGVEFKKTLPEKLPTAPLDKRLMRMTLENLLTNAVKYTEKGKQVELHVRVENNVLKYEVKDQGCGIPKADQDKIFDKLYRASNVRNVDGNGFGLYAARGAAEAQEGKVWFTSIEGKGTTFFVEIPLGK